MTIKWLSCQGDPKKDHLHAANQQKKTLFQPLPKKIVVLAGIQTLVS